MCSDMGSKFVAFNEEVHTKRERRKAGKVNATDMNRFRVLVDLLEADLEKFQMSDPQYYRKYFNPFVPYFKLVFGLISIILTVCWIIQIVRGAGGWQGARAAARANAPRHRRARPLLAPLPLPHPARSSSCC